MSIHQASLQEYEGAGDILYNCMRVWDLSWAAKCAEYLVAYDRVNVNA
jgi:hypothetical protein